MSHKPNLSGPTSRHHPIEERQPNSGHRLGNWQLLDLLGEGTHSRVFLGRPAACPRNWPTDYAIKVMREEFQQRPEAQLMMRREAALGRLLSHPHLVAILDASFEATVPFLVMPRLVGATLDQVLASASHLTIPHALWVVRQVAEALTVLHENGWCHGDVKPDNIFVAPNGHVTLFDLGLSMQTQNPGCRLVGSRNGTLSHVAPELLTSTLRADARSDIYSLGVTLYQLVSGRLPFPQVDTASLTEAHLTRIPPNPRRWLPQLPLNVVSLIRRMLAKEPLRRPQSADETVTALRRLEIDCFDERLVA